ncbi:MAG: hypothetical protein PVJ67_01920 [Candidatus Pacearchaeota archaeon]|jgi:hypothetical protein
MKKGLKDSDRIEIYRAACENTELLESETLSRHDERIIKNIMNI